MLKVEANAHEMEVRLSQVWLNAEREGDMSKNHKTEERKGGSSEPWLLRVEEAAELVGVSRSFLYNLISSGQLPSVRIGGCRRIWADQLRERLVQQS